MLWFYLKSKSCQTAERSTTINDSYKLEAYGVEPQEHLSYLFQNISFTRWQYIPKGTEIDFFATCSSWLSINLAFFSEYRFLALRLASCFQRCGMDNACIPKDRR